MAKLLVDDDGLVDCPRHGTVDLGHCVRCRDLRDLRVEDGRHVVVCAGRHRAIDEIAATLYR